jgi:hypothetical protein
LAEEIPEVHEQFVVTPQLMNQVIETMVIAEQSVAVESAMTQSADIEQHVEPAKEVTTLKTEQSNEALGSLLSTISTEQVQPQTIEQPLFASVAEEATLLAENVATKQEIIESITAEQSPEPLPEPLNELLSNTNVIIDDNVHQAIQILVDAHTEDMLVTEIIQTPINEGNNQKISIENKIEQRDQYQIKPEISINIESSEIAKENIAELQGEKLEGVKLQGEKLQGEKLQGEKQEQSQLFIPIIESSIGEALVRNAVTESADIISAPFTQYVSEEPLSVDTINSVKSVTIEAANVNPTTVTDNTQMPLEDNISVTNTEKLTQREDQGSVPAAIYQELISTESRGNINTDTLAQSISETPIVEYREAEIQSTKATQEITPTFISSLPEYQNSNDSNQLIVDTKEVIIQETGIPLITQQIERDRVDQISFVTDAEIRSLNHEAALTAFFAPAEISSLASYDSSLIEQGRRPDDSYSTSINIKAQPLSVEAVIAKESDAMDPRIVLKQPVTIDMIENETGTDLEKEVRKELTLTETAAEAQANSIVYNSEYKRLAELSALAQIKRGRRVFDRGEKIKARLALLAQEGGRLDKERLRRQMPLLRLLHPALGRREMKAQKDENLRRVQPGFLSGTR